MQLALFRLMCISSIKSEITSNISFASYVRYLGGMMEFKTSSTCVVVLLASTGGSLPGDFFGLSLSRGSPFSWISTGLSYLISESFTEVVIFEHYSVAERT
jgi:hypothetical protein